MAFNLADMVSKRQKQPQTSENISDTVYRDVFDLVPSKENFYSTAPDKLQGLKNSIQLFGVMQDVLIEDVNGEDHIISGHCRTMCCRMLVEEGHEEFRKINCKYAKPQLRTENLEETDEKVDVLVNRLALIQANRFREKSDWEKMQEALVTEEIIKELRGLTDLKGSTRKMVQETLGVSGTQMERYHSIQKGLCKDFMEEFKAAHINISVARELADLDEDYQKQAMEHYTDHNASISLAEVKAFKELQENEKGIQGQISIDTLEHKHQKEENIYINPQIQIERFYEGLNHSEKERIEKCDKKMAAYLIGIRYSNVRISNENFNFQGEKGGIIFNPESNADQISWNDLADKLIEKFGKKQKPVKMVSIDAPERNEKKELNMAKCLNGISGSGYCGAAAYCNKVYSCCRQCDDICNSYCGWLEKRCQTEYKKDERQQVTDERQQSTIETAEQNNMSESDTGHPVQWDKDLSDIPLPSLTAVNDFLETAEKQLKEYTEVYENEKFPFKILQKQQLWTAGLRIIKNMVMDCNKEKEEEPDQPELPKFKNDTQRKQWLTRYKDWGVWYKDQNTGCTYYKYDFDNGARLIAEVYLIPKQKYIPEYESVYFHLIGGPEPKKNSNGIPKWNRHEVYERYQNNETELVEFLKEIQRKEE